MGRLLWLPDVLRDEGLRVVTVPNWGTRGGNHLSPRVLLDHHTASAQGRNAPSLNVIAYRGNGYTPPPLSNILTARDGTVYVVASGVTNNAGRGSFPKHSAYGNAHTIGHEIENDGRGEPWTAALLDTVARVDAAICRRLKWPADRIVGHKEWAPGRKIDPTYNMDTHRARVTQLLTRQEDDMTARIIAAYIAGGRDRQQISWEEVCVWVDEIGRNNDPEGTLAYITWAVSQ